jgi:PilZ domain
MNNDRRSEQRIPINLPVKWDGMSGTHESRLEDISLFGCFVKTTGRVEIDEVISLEIRLPSGEWLPLRGEVTSYQPGIGFGLLFSFLIEEEEEALKDLIGSG